MCEKQIDWRELWSEYAADIKHHYVRDDCDLEQALEWLLQEHPTYKWRSVSDLANDLGETKSHVYEALCRMEKAKSVVRNDRTLANDDTDTFGLVERVQKLVTVSESKTFPANNFDVMQGCLREVQKLISQAQTLNNQITSIDLSKSA